MTGPLFTPKSLAEYLDISERQVHNLIGGPEPEIPSLLIGPQQRRIRPEDVQAYLNRKLGAEA